MRLFQITESGQSALSQYEKRLLSTEDARKLLFAVERGTEAVSQLLDQGADINARLPFSYPGGRAGWTVLIKACYEGAQRVVEFLLEKGADVSHATTFGVTPLIAAAARRAERQIVQALVKKGADLNAATINGRTALIWQL